MPLNEAPPAMDLSSAGCVEEIPAISPKVRTEWRPAGPRHNTIGTAVRLGRRRLRRGRGCWVEGMKTGGRAKWPLSVASELGWDRL
eukprot:1315903-Amorphochlora_amoeboformis.AAC.2